MGSSYVSDLCNKVISEAMDELSGYIEQEIKRAMVEGGHNFDELEMRAFAHKPGYQELYSTKEKRVLAKFQLKWTLDKLSDSSPPSD